MLPLLYDVAVIGGGPAGATAAALLAQHGRRVVLLERDRFPRFHIGESLLPYSLTAFDRLGIRERLEQTAVIKHGGEVATGCGTRSVKFYFRDGFRLQHHRSYQVERADFDAMLLNRARENGAAIREGCAVQSVGMAEDRVILQTDSGEITAAYVVDASGRQSLVGRAHGARKTYAHLQKLSFHAHYRGVQRDAGDDAGLTRLVRTESSWFWLIPLDADRTSIGAVIDSAEFKARALTPEAALEQAVAGTPLMRERMAGAERIGPVHAAGDYSFRHRHLAGPRWLLAGDAAGFIDPIFSTGVFLAVHSGEQCADMLHEVLTHPARRRRLFKNYERGLHRLMNMYLRFVTAWYRPEFIDVFTNPNQRFQLASAVNSVLAGNVDGGFAIWWRMQIFYLVLFLQRFAALCPRLARADPDLSAPEDFTPQPNHGTPADSRV